jgi:hypothetical protein
MTQIIFMIQLIHSFLLPKIILQPNGSVENKQKLSIQQYFLKIKFNLLSIQNILN